MRTPRFLHVLAAALFLPALASYADTVTTFNLASTTNAFGTVTIDTTTGAVLAIDLGFQGLSSEAGVPSTLVESYGPPLNFTEIGEDWTGQPGVNYSAGITLDVPVASLVGYAGGNICSLDNPCVNGDSILLLDVEDHDFVDGTLTPTPEPSSLTLFATGALGVAGVMRRKLLRA